MIGQYTNSELMNMGNIISSVSHLFKGLVTRKIGRTYNYYIKEKDGSWTNYDCKTK